MPISDEAYAGARGHRRQGERQPEPGGHGRVRLPVAGRPRPPGAEPLHAPPGGGGHARLHRGSAGRRPPRQQVQDQGQAPRHGLVSLGRADLRRQRHHAARHAAHERHRDRREERHRHRGAVRDPRAVACGGHQARLDLHHHRRRLLLLGGGGRLRVRRHGAGRLLDGRTFREPSWHGVGHAQRRDRPQRLVRLGSRLRL